MTWRLDAWSRFASPGFWWMDVMLAVWAIFALMLFVVEPAFLHRRLQQALADPASGLLFDRMERLHRILLAVSLLAVLGAVGGSHGLWG